MKMLCVLVLSVAAVTAQNDSVTLVNGSRIVGQVSVIDRDGVSIDSGTGAQRISWGDVAQLQTLSQVPVLLGNGDRMTISVNGLDESRNLVGMIAGIASCRIDPSGLAAGPPPPPVLPAPPVEVPAEEKGPWSGKIAVSGTVRSGNVDSTLGAFHGEAVRAFERDKLSGVIDALYGDTEGVRTAASVGGRLRYDHFFGETFYGYAQAEALHDEIQNIDLRAILSVGVGDILWKKSDEKFWSVEGGIAGIYEDFSTDDDAELSPAFRGATIYKNVFFDSLRFEQLLEVLIPFDDPGRWLGRSLSVLSVPVSKSMRMRASLELNYQADPPGDTKNLDVIGLVGLEVQF